MSEGGGTDQKAGGQQKRVKILQGGCDWKVESDLFGRLVFPVAAAITRLRLTWSYGQTLPESSSLGNSLFHGKNTCRKQTSARKPSTPPLMSKCAQKQWQVHCLPFEVGCRGFAGTSLMTFLHKLGITHQERKFVCKSASNAALRASTWIWAKHRNGPSWCHQAPVRSGTGVSALVHWPTSPTWYWV